MAVTLVTAFTFVIAMLIADISYSIIDPRIEYK
jgi:ABC-type dipeptide/oligopeptide/nickel transport system permease component